MYVSCTQICISAERDDPDLLFNANLSSLEIKTK